MRWSAKDSRILLDPILKSIGYLVYYSCEIDVEKDMLIQHVLSVLGMTDFDDDCESTKNRIGIVIDELCRNENLLTRKLGKIYLTRFGLSKSSSLKDKSFKNIIKKCRVEDDRDLISWVAVELSPIGESKLEDGSIERIIRKTIKLDECHPIFIPKATYQEDDETISLHLLDGYVFIQSGLPEVTYFKLEYTPYVTKVLSRVGSSGVRALSVVPDRIINDMRDQISCLSVNDLRKGDVVTVVDGMYKGLDVSVMEICSDQALVRTHGLRSIDIVTSIPIGYLSNVR